MKPLLFLIASASLLACSDAQTRPQADDLDRVPRPPSSPAVGVATGAPAAPARAALAADGGSPARSRVPAGLLSAAAAAPFQQCTDDAQCTIVGNGCCGEGAGEPGIGIRRGKEKAFAAALPCEEVACKAMAYVDICNLSGILREFDDASCPEQAEKVATCVEGRCSYEGIY